jgi:hypothetical protein
MVQKASVPKVNPIVRTLAAQTTDEPNVQLTGFIGEAEKGFIRICFSLDMSTYANVSKGGGFILSSQIEMSYPPVFYQGLFRH